MATDMSRLQGEIAEHPAARVIQEGEDIGVERLLAGFLRSLLDEQKPSPTPIAIPSTGNEVPSLKLKESV